MDGEAGPWSRLFFFDVGCVLDPQMEELLLVLCPWVGPASADSASPIFDQAGMHVLMHVPTHVPAVSRRLCVEGWVGKQGRDWPVRRPPLPRPVCDL